MAARDLSRPLRVASVPAGHPYVQHLTLDRAGIELLADPRPVGAEAGRWWPPVMLDERWITKHSADFDLLHIHFGTESLSTTALSRALDALAARRRPLVFTVHDLEHPQLRAAEPYDAQLDLLVRRAAQVITLTRGAAAEIHQRWGRTAMVIPHPRMVGAGVPLPRVSAAGAPVVALHLRDLRPNIDGLGAVRALGAALVALRSRGIHLRGRVLMFDRIRDPAQAEAIEAAAAQTGLELSRRDRLSEVELVADLCATDVSVLPYRHGTHSGWAELCWDLGVPMLAAPIGHIADQHDEPGWLRTCDVFDPSALAEALGQPCAPDRRSRTALIAERRAVRDAQAPALASAHRRVYAAALSGSESDQVSPPTGLRPETREPTVQDLSPPL